MPANRLDRATESLIRSLAGKLQDRGLYCATAESCTGGWIAQVLTSVSGSSNWFDCGFITYSNESKTRLLGVGKDTIEEYGAVSEEVAREMAIGAVENSRAKVAVSVTGIAGPEGGSEHKPVGTVVFGWLVPGVAVPDVETIQFAGDRTDIRWLTVEHALAGMHSRLN